MDIAEFTERSREWTPLVICGVARSGTRMISDILNLHAEIEVEAEMHAKTIEAYFTFQETVQAKFDHYSERKGFRLYKNWKKNKHALHHIFLAATAKQTAQKPFEKDIRYHAFKMPGYERYFENFEKHFHPALPLYIYAIRDVGSVWRSWLTRAFTDDLELFRTRYKRSLRQALKIKRKAPDRFVVFDLDSYVGANDKAVHLRETILAPLNVEDKIRWPENEVPNTNSASAIGRVLADGNEIKYQMDDLRADEDIQVLRANLLEPPIKEI